MAQIGNPLRIIQTPEPIVLPDTVPLSWPDNAPIEPSYAPVAPVEAPVLVPA